MSLCICCKHESNHEETLLEVQTLHIRDYSGEQRIQALGSVVRSSVCDSCVEAKRTAILSPGRSLFLHVAVYLALTLAGGILFTILTDLPLKVPCAGAVLLGLLGSVLTIRTTMEQKKHLEDLTTEQARNEVRLQILKDCLPRKVGENNMTYIALSALREAESGALIAKYDLLPPIAKEAIKRKEEYYGSL
ncbi:MAG: hypothetical protein ACRC3H_16610 [Lachnospiraceae bacterium]